jgi:hypothetical protein
MCGPVCSLLMCEIAVCSENVVVKAPAAAAKAGGTKSSAAAAASAKELSPPQISYVTVSELEKVPRSVVQLDGRTFVSVADHVAAATSRVVHRLKRSTLQSTKSSCW